MKYVAKNIQIFTVIAQNLIMTRKLMRFIYEQGGEKDEALFYKIMER